MTRIVLCTNEPMLAKGLQSVLRQIEDFDLLLSCNTLAGLKEQMAHDPPDLLLMDLTPEITFASLSELKSVMVGSKIVLWVNTISTELAFQAMGLGIRGILRKTLATELQVKCLQKVRAGELWFEKALTDCFFSARRVILSRREGQLIGLVSKGMKNKEIATALMIEEGTVKVYLSRLFQKVGVKDRFELALFGLKNMTAEQFPMGEKEPGADAGSAPGPRLVMEKPAEPGGSPARVPNAVLRPAI